MGVGQNGMIPRGWGTTSAQGSLFFFPFWLVFASVFSAVEISGQCSFHYPSPSAFSCPPSCFAFSLYHNVEYVYRVEYMPCPLCMKAKVIFLRENSQSQANHRSRQEDCMYKVSPPSACASNMIKSPNLRVCVVSCRRCLASALGKFQGREIFLAGAYLSRLVCSVYVSTLMPMPMPESRLSKVCIYVHGVS